MCNIIGFCGRLQSGKTTLAKICEEYGYERIYFALPLKQLVGQLFHMTVEEIDKLKNVDGNYTLQDMDMKYLSDETNIPLDIIKKTLSTKNFSFKNTREIMQFIGTDIIRAYNSDWHVNKVKEMISPVKKYVIDDIRFQNELNLIKELNGSLWYVSRPKLDNVSNHISETSIKWQDIDNVITNDCSLECLTTKWRSFMSEGYAQSLQLRKEVQHMLKTGQELMSKFKMFKNQFVITERLLISVWECLYKEYDFSAYKNIKIVQEDDKDILELYTVKDDIDTLEVVRNPLVIEDYKFKMFEI